MNPNINMTGIQGALEAMVAFILGDDTAETADLARWLDQIACMVSQIDMVEDNFPYLDAPNGDYTVLRSAIARRFPTMGLYNIVADISGHIGETTCAIGDSIDDVVDITQEIQSVLWRFAHTSNEDAIWHLVFSYRTHWGHHLRHLQLYLQDSSWWRTEGDA